jgi:hypothetical protein
MAPFVEAEGVDRRHQVFASRSGEAGHREITRLGREGTGEPRGGGRSPSPGAALSVWSSPRARTACLHEGQIDATKLCSPFELLLER